MPLGSVLLVLITSSREATPTALIACTALFDQVKHHLLQHLAKAD